MALPYDVDGTWVDSGASYSAGELRRADAAMISQAGISSGLAVSVDGSDVVTIQPGSAVISGEDAVVGTGVYRSGIPAAVTGSLAARDATNSRIDLVVFRQLDTDVVPSHPARTSRIEIIAGTPSATPAVPAKPSMAVELARITVPASGGGAASVNSANRVLARAVGGVQSRGESHVYAGTTQTQTHSYTFPVQFASAPIVALSWSDERFTCAVKNVTTTGFDVTSYYIPGSASASFALGLSWIAAGV